MVETRRHATLLTMNAIDSPHPGAPEGRVSKDEAPK